MSKGDWGEPLAERLPNLKKNSATGPGRGDDKERRGAEGAGNSFHVKTSERAGARRDPPSGPQLRTSEEEKKE